MSQQRIRRHDSPSVGRPGTRRRSNDGSAGPSESGGRFWNGAMSPVWFCLCPRGAGRAARGPHRSLCAAALPCGGPRASASDKATAEKALRPPRRRLGCPQGMGTPTSQRRRPDASAPSARRCTPRRPPRQRASSTGAAIEGRGVWLLAPRRSPWKGAGPGEGRCFDAEPGADQAREKVRTAPPQIHYGRR